MKYRIETERVDLFDASIVITMNVRLSKEAVFDDLKAAFEKACSLHEVLRSKIVIEESGEAFYVDNESPGNSFSQTELSLTELINDNERRRFRIEEGEFIRAFLSPDGLVFMMHHLGGDGKSLLYFIETYMRCLAGEEPEYMPFRNLTLDKLPASSRLPFFYEVLIRSWNRKWLKEKKIFGFEDLDREYIRYWDGRKTGIEIKRYEKDELDALLKKAGAAGVSLTAYLITDLIKDSGRKMDIGLAVDGRTDKNRAMGNQATGISVEYRYNEKKSFEENAKAVYALMQKKLSNDRYRYFVLQFMGKLDTSLKDSLNLERAGCFSSKMSSQLAELLGYGEKVRDISITNLTRADIPIEYGDFRIEQILFIPPIVSYAGNVFGIVTAGDVMYVCRHTYDRQTG